MPVAVAPYAREDFQRVAGETLRPGGLTLTARALAACRFAPGARVLDLGCGPGATLGLLAEDGLRAAGLDASKEFLAQAAPRGPVVRGRAQELPLRDGCLDGVFCECVLSATGDAPATLAAIARALRPGGLLALTDLYLRPGPQPGSAAAGCVAGAVPREVLTRQLEVAGLAPLFFEDHTKLLTELACRLTMALGSAQSVVAMLTGRDPACAGGPRPRLGYCLILAAKETP
ncbi:DVU_1556 family methyltransferase [Solidesulfovibrio sp.]|uniref:DVU_1556 family methyltransferase n=1 Tax=Solidesulfovibrio sp. TaxID=2910990 RepID=UPI002B21CAD2|nr:class I SAM-dependent methyltransferase [Solidesulfovibrio sp.]MEA5087427.1 class I SAM-dependent methyltransferase [Solidesulfovibrio sp.]